MTWAMTDVSSTVTQTLSSVPVPRESWTSLSPMQSHCFPGSMLRAANTVVLLAGKSSCIVPIIGTLGGQFNHYQQWNHRILGLEKPYRLLCCRPQERGFYKCCFLLMLHVVVAEEDPLPSLKVLCAVIRSQSKYFLELSLLRHLLNLNERPVCPVLGGRGLRSPPLRSRRCSGRVVVQAVRRPGPSGGQERHGQCK